MRAGNLDRTISLQRLTIEVGDTGTIAETWTDYAPAIRAQLVAPEAITLVSPAPRRLDATESDRQYGQTEIDTLVFRVRYVPSVTTADRLIYEGNPYRIIGTTEIGRRRGLDIRCERRH